MRALAYPFDEDQTLRCCACTEQILAEPGFLRMLYLATTRPIKISCDDKCPRCGDYYGSKEAQCAAERIAKMSDMSIG